MSNSVTERKVWCPTFVFIEDRIRDERVRHRVNVDSPVDTVIEGYVDQFGLPRRDFDLSHIEYRLMRAVDETYLSGETTLRQAGIAEGELLELFSPEGRRVWGSVQRLLGEIESEIRDPITGEFKDRVAEEAWERATKKLEEIEKTHTGGRRVEQIREWVECTRGPTKDMESVEEVAEAVEQYRAASTGRDKGAGGKGGKAALTIGALVILGVILVIGSVLVYGSIFAPGDGAVSPDTTERPIASATELGAQPPTQRSVAPEDEDTDGDGLTDEFEAGIGADAGNPDTDGDGYGDGEEIDMGTNPLDANDPTTVRVRVSSSSDWVWVSLVAGGDIVETHTVETGGVTTRATMEDCSIDLIQELERAEAGQTVYIVQDITLAGLAEDLEFKIERGCLGETVVEVFNLVTGDPMLVERFLALECYPPTTEYFTVDASTLLAEAPPPPAAAEPPPPPAAEPAPPEAAPPPTQAPPAATPTDTPEPSPTPKSTTTFRLINSSTHTICEFNLGCDWYEGPFGVSIPLWGVPLDASDPCTLARNALGSSREASGFS